MDFARPDHQRQILARRPLLLAGLAAFGARTARAEEEAPAPQVIAIYGDSMAQGVGHMLNQSLLRDRRFRVINRGRPATALGQPGNHNWMEAVRNSVRQDRPGYSVMMFGGNDRLAMRRAGNGPHIPFRSEAWVELYRERLGAMLQPLAESQVRIVWVGYPIAREPRYSGDMAFLNDIYRREMEARSQVYIDTWTMFADEQGRFVPERRNAQGRVTRLRTEDGIHLTAAGYDMVAQRVKTKLEELHAARTPAAPAAGTPAEGQAQAGAGSES